METNTEVEVKFSLSDETDEVSLVETLKEIFSRNSWNVTSDRTDRRNFLYYDTPDLEVYKKSETIRRVGGFDIRIHRGGFRYDYKSGPMECRLEAKCWDDRVLDPKDICKLLDLPYQNIQPTAPAETLHRFLYIEKDGTKIEVKLDNYDLFNGLFLRELELEIMQGQEQDLRDLCGELQKRLALVQSNKQKYSQIIELIR
jgi:hypothetical protein